MSPLPPAVHPPAKPRGRRAPHVTRQPALKRAPRSSRSLLPVAFKKLYETNNPANVIYDKTIKTELDPAPKNVLYAVEEDDGKARLTLELQTPLAIEGMWAVVRNGLQGVDAHGHIPANEERIEIELSEPLVAFTEPDADDGWEIFVGIDANNNSKLDETERVPLTISEMDDEPVKTHIIAKRKYLESRLIINSGSLLSGFASQLLRIFADDDEFAPSAAWRPTSTTVRSFDCFNDPYSDWLTHNSGENFNGSGVTENMKFCHWDRKAEPSEAIGNDSVIADAIRQRYISELFGTFTAGMSGVSIGSTKRFPSAGFYPLGIDGDRLMDETFSALGYVKLSGWGTAFLVRKTGTATFELAQTFVRGTAEDLYDFNYTSAFPGIQAAILQLGYGDGSRGRDEGVIYRDTFFVEHTWEGLPE